MGINCKSLLETHAYCSQCVLAGLLVVMEDPVTFLVPLTFAPPPFSSTWSLVSGPGPPCRLWAEGCLGAEQ